jgi:hypothetical protein
MNKTVPDHPHTELIAGLREMASLLESRPDLAVGGARLSLGVLDSRADLEAWAAELDAEITMGGTDGDIPVIWHQMPAFEFNAQAPAEPAHSRLAQAEAEIARLRAELATRTGADDACKCGFRAPELGPHPACPVHTTRTESDR